MDELNRLYYASLLTGVSLGAVSVLLPLYLSSDFDASLTSMGLLFSVASLVLISLHIPASFLSDKFGRKKLIILSTLLKSGAFAIFSRARNLPLFAIGKALQGAGEVLPQAPSDGMLIELSREDSYSGSFGKYIGYFSVGFCFGYFISGPLAEHIGLQDALLFLVLFELLSALLIWTIPECRSGAHHIKFNLKKFFLKPKGVLKIFALNGFLTRTAECMDYTVTVLFLHQVLGANVSEIGLAMGLSWLAFGIIQIKFGGAVDKQGRRSLYIFGISTAAFCAFLLPNSGSIWLFIPIFTILGAGFGIAIPAARGLVAKYASKKYTAQDFGFLSFFEDLGPLVGMPLMGFVADNFGFYSAFYLRGALLFSAVAITFVTLGSSDKSNGQEVLTS